MNLDETSLTIEKNKDEFDASHERLEALEQELKAHKAEFGRQTENIYQTIAEVKNTYVSKSSFDDEMEREREKWNEFYKKQQEQINDLIARMEISE